MNKTLKATDTEYRHTYTICNVNNNKKKQFNYFGCNHIGVLVSLFSVLFPFFFQKNFSAVSRRCRSFERI